MTAFNRPLFQNESKCETIHMKTSLICIWMNLWVKIIFKWKFSHLDSFWNKCKGTRKLSIDYVVLWRHNQQITILFCGSSSRLSRLSTKDIMLSICPIITVKTQEGFIKPTPTPGLCYMYVATAAMLLLFCSQQKLR